MYLVLRSEKVETPTRRRHRGPPRRRRKVSSEKRESFADSLSLVLVLEREVEKGNGWWTGSRPYIGQRTGSPMGQPMVSPWPVLKPNVPCLYAWFTMRTPLSCMFLAVFLLFAPLPVQISSQKFLNFSNVFLIFFLTFWWHFCAKTWEKHLKHFFSLFLLELVIFLHFLVQKTF